jgi:non-specific protein-tyrosine kinase
VSETQTERASTLELRDYFRILGIRKWTAFFVFALVVSGALYLSFRQIPVYRSEARVLVPPPASGVTSTGLIIEGKPNLENEAAIARSEEVAKPVATALGLDGTDDRVIQRLLRSVSVAPQKSADILIFRAESDDPVEAQAIAASFAEAYLQFRRTENAATLQNQVTTLDSQIGAKKAQLESERDDAVIAQLNADIAQLELQKQPLENAIGTIKKTSGRIIQDARVPQEPVRPDHVRDGILAGIVGLVLGCGAAFLRDYVDDSLRGVEDVERQAGATLIGVIPHVDRPETRKRDRDERAYLVAADEPKAPATEAYRTLRTNLMFMAATGPLRVLLLTSPLQGEGKSTTAANLSVVMAQAGQRVLLVGADLRRPALHRFFGMSNRIGLSSVLSGQSELAEVVQDPGIRDLRVMAGGPVPPNPAELLGSTRMRALLDEVSEVADWVILDGPPVLGLADALVLSAFSDGALMVVNEATNRRILAHARDQLAKVQARQVGAILNNFGPAFSYYYSDYYLYSSAYYQAPDQPEEPRRLSRRERKRQAALAAEQAAAMAGGNGSQNGETEGRPAATRSGDFFAG